MIGLYKYIESPFGEKTYFAGANSGVGFVNLFGDFYEESSLDRLYIIKGGPGTGKSTFMRILAERAADAGAGAEYFLCGSDPSSLDAVVLSGGGRRIAVIDGTSPHAYDAKYPGAVSAVLDFGSFWDKGILESERGRIISLAKKKSGCFERSYRFLAALSVMRRDLRSVTARAIDRKKLDAFVRRCVAALPESADYRRRFRTREAFTMKGAVSLGFPANHTLWSVSGREDAHGEVMSALAEALSAGKRSHTVFRDSVDTDKISALYIDCADIYIGSFPERPPEASRNINISRFLLPDRLKDSRNKRRFTEKCALSLASGAADALSEAGTYHFELEEIYKRAMDFGRLAEAEEKLYREITDFFR